MSDVAQQRAAPVDPYADPATLARLGMLVRQRLRSIPGVEQVDAKGADMFVVPGFLTRKDCADIVKVINQRAVPSTIYRGKESSENFRTSYTHHFARDDPLTQSIESYISDLIGIADTFSETMQGQRYKVGQEFRHHHDFFYTNSDYWQFERTHGGQRSWTAMVNLNEPREGGETDFPQLGIRVRPKTGTLVLWNNMDANGHPNPRTLHAGLPVLRGIKHVITKWYRQEPWRLLNTDSSARDA